MELRHVRGEALDGGSLTGQRQQADDGLVDFGPVKDTAATQNHGHFFHGKLLVVENVSQDGLLYFCMVIARPPLIVSFWILPYLLP